MVSLNRRSKAAITSVVFVCVVFQQAAGLINHRLTAGDAFRNSEAVITGGPFTLPQYLFSGLNQGRHNVNIGAGTITCNYDGANKFKTIIGDDVFVGSDTQLVAPVTVGKGATIAAGTTVTRNVGENALAISRVPQTQKEGWRRPVKKK